MALDITRLSGGNTPADGSDPRTFPAIWNSTATEIETLQSSGVYAHGRVAANGTAVYLSGLSVTKSGTGTYDYTFSTSLPNANYSAQVTVVGTDVLDDPTALVTSFSSSGFQVQTRSSDNGASDDPLIDISHSILVVR